MFCLVQPWLDIVSRTDITKNMKLKQWEKTKNKEKIHVIHKVLRHYTFKGYLKTLQDRKRLPEYITSIVRCQVSWPKNFCHNFFCHTYFSSIFCRHNFFWNINCLLNNFVGHQIFVVIIFFSNYFLHNFLRHKTLLYIQKV